MGGCGELLTLDYFLQLTLEFHKVAHKIQQNFPQKTADPDNHLFGDNNFSACNVY